LHFSHSKYGTHVFRECISFGVRTFSPTDSSPHGRFAPQMFHPALDISPHGQFAHRHFTPLTWGEVSIDVLPCTRHFAPWGIRPQTLCPMDVRRNLHRRFAPHPWGETSMGQSSIGLKYLVWGETSIGQIAHGAKHPYMGTVLGAKSL